MEIARTKKYLLKTLGCKANFFDGLGIESQLEARGWQAQTSADPAPPELCIVNSCSVTDEADKQSRKLAERLKKQYPGAKIVFTGCSAEIDPDYFRSAQGVDWVVGNQDKHRFAELVLNGFTSQTPSQKLLGRVLSYGELKSLHPMDREWPLPERLESLPEHSRTRHFLKIQEGCDSFCTYCIIPYGRGPSRSLRPREVLEEIRKVVDQGVREIILTGTNIGDYGIDWSDGGRDESVRGLEFAKLVAQILAHTSLERLRLSSLDPLEIRPELLTLMHTEHRLMPHFHVSLQATESETLRRMKRPYRQEDVSRTLTAIDQIRRDGRPVFVGMDLITGFPGETRTQFEASRQRLADLPWTRLHVFPYSERKGTPATRLPGSVPIDERRRRARELSALSFERLQGFYEGLVALPKLEGILFEGAARGPDGSKDWITGHTPDYARVLVRPVRRHESVSGAPHRSLQNTVGSVRPRELFRDRAAQDIAIWGD